MTHDKKYSAWPTKCTTGAALIVLALALAGCGGSDESPESDGSPTPTVDPTTEATTSPSEAPTTSSAPTGPTPVALSGFDFEVGGACPQILVTAGGGGATSYVVSGPAANVEQWEPEFTGPAAEGAESDEPVFAAGVTAAGDPFVLAALVTDVVGSALEADMTQLEITTLDTATDQPLGPAVALPWEASQEVPALPECVGDRLAFQMNEIGAGSFNKPVAVVFDLASGKQVFRESLAVAENSSLAVSGDRILATLASAYEDVQNTGQAPVASTALDAGASEIVIGGNAFDYAYFGVDQTWIPGLAGGDKQPNATSGQAYESYTFPAAGTGSSEAPFVTTLDTTGSVLDFYDPASKTKLMVATDLNGDAAAVAALDFETGRKIPLDWFPKNSSALDLHVYGFYDGNLWVTSKGKPLVLTTAGDEVPEAADWKSFPQYVGEGWAVLGSPDDESIGVAFPGSFEPVLTTQSVDDLDEG